jgi:hypothetical protein
MTGYSAERTTQLLDRLAIEETMARYARGVDRIDIPLIKSTFWPGATDEHGTWNGPADEFADYLNTSLRAFEATQHALCQMHIEYYDSGNKADVETYFIAKHVMTEAAGGVTFVLGGRYLDQMEKRDGEWKIAYRRLVRDWADIPEGADAVEALLGKIQRRGKPDGQDPWDLEIVAARS